MLYSWTLHCKLKPSLQAPLKLSSHLSRRWPSAHAQRPRSSNDAAALQMLRNTRRFGESRYFPMPDLPYTNISVFFFPPPAGYEQHKPGFIVLK